MAENMEKSYMQLTGNQELLISNKLAKYFGRSCRIQEPKI